MTREYGDPTYYYGNMAGFVVWDSASIYRTADILAATPVWEEITGTIDGTIIDGRCVIKADDIPAMWLLTTTAVFYCADISAATPSWSEKLAIETVQATEVDVDGAGAGASAFKAMAVSTSAPDYCIVGTSPAGYAAGAAQEYLHAYFWYSTDAGANWNTVDMSGFTATYTVSGPFTRCYCLMDAYALSIDPSATDGQVGSIYAVREVPVIGSQYKVGLFKSADGGATWSKLGASDADYGSLNAHTQGILAPAAANSRPGYLSAGPVGVSDRPDIYRTTDDFANLTQLTSNGDPTGYGGLSLTNPEARVSGRYNDANYVMALFRHTASATNDLLESTDQGDTWSVLWDSGLSAYWSPPINWPPDPDVWVLVRNNNGTGGTLTNFSDVIKVTSDGFATVLEKSSNIDGLDTAWRYGLGGGFPLPKLPSGIDASLVSWFRVQAAQQSAFDTPVAPAFALPVVFDYQQGDVEQLAQWDSGTWTPLEIVELVASFATFKLRGALCFETLPVLLNAGFGAMTPSGAGPYAYAGSAGLAAVGEPSPYTFRFGGNQGSGGSMVQIADAYLHALTLTYNLNAKIVTFESEWFGRWVDDNSGAGYAPEDVALPDGLKMVNGLLATVGLQDASDTGGAFDALTALDCALIEWQLAIDTGLRPMWAADKNALTYCGVRHEEPSAVWSPHIRTTLNNYALVLAKAAPRTYQELQLSLTDTDREFTLQMTGRFIGKVNGHERTRGEVVMKPTFQVKTSRDQVTTPHWMDWAITAGWEHGA